ncbi:serine/threonine protein kinase [Cellulomonas flavigena DSM 20109]|uniref:non-specific serine/threonine protein kinase n=1 Tax=Cellulomonas flavigena (strain ATCC 482 / DSM 20109 / BCRC 11376 / JCM 18109 / NBRC 3775 / NCIMB 8073 / NRS 134) TaxID=446466 RepID=D5UG67_CELFN|nr:serine/threonine-protein kinase [Cellulomonas flavigena]ADG75090.1 serine/threonine protein kinase [Cellulomonas flavigena DSM 20109]
MTARREASAPPDLPGYEYVRVLGLGGFADVFLYRQHLPRRDVAVKVLLAGSLDDDVRERFQTEANLMAQLSHHPSIVTIHHAAIAPDGRPYLVMEYCSRTGLAERYRVERIPVPEVLRIGVRLASAVETAHRAGILHRDIKPANVLTTDFGWPALTDFGIAATTGPAVQTMGMSIPWSPPELLAEHPTGDERSDVYALAATVYSLLAGRSPFELPGGNNSAQQLVARIERSPLPSVGREDVPPQLQAVLERAMAKHPSRRFESAVAVARALQEVEAALRLPVTPLDLPDDPSPVPHGVTSGTAPGAAASPFGPPPVVARAGADVLDEDATRLRGVATPGPAVPPGLDEDATRARAVVVGRPVLVAPAPPQAAPPVGVPDAPVGRRGARVAALVAGGVVLAAVVGVLVATVTGDEPEPPVPSETFAPPQTGPAAGPVPAPHSLAGTRADDGSVTFTWQNPDPQDGDRYLWGVLTATGEPTYELVDAERVTVPADQATGEVCIEVSIVRADRSRSALPAEGCTP